MNVLGRIFLNSRKERRKEGVFCEISLFKKEKKKSLKNVRNFHSVSYILGLFVYSIFKSGVNERGL